MRRRDVGCSLHSHTRPLVSQWAVKQRPELQIQVSSDELNNSLGVFLGIIKGPVLFIHINHIVAHVKMAFVRD